MPPSRCGDIIPSQQPVPCISGGPDIATSGVPASTRRSACAVSSDASSGGRPTMPGYASTKNWVNSRSGYITPFGIPVVPPV